MTLRSSVESAGDWSVLPRGEVRRARRARVETLEPLGVAQFRLEALFYASVRTPSRTIAFVWSFVKYPGGKPRGTRLTHL